MQYLQKHLRRTNTMHQHQTPNKKLWMSIYFHALSDYLAVWWLSVGHVQCAWETVLVVLVLREIFTVFFSYLLSVIQCGHSELNRCKWILRRSYSHLREGHNQTYVSRCKHSNLRFFLVSVRPPNTPLPSLHHWPLTTWSLVSPAQGTTQPFPNITNIQQN